MSFAMGCMRIQHACPDSSATRVEILLDLEFRPTAAIPVRPRASNTMPSFTSPSRRPCASNCWPGDGKSQIWMVELIEMSCPARVTLLDRSSIAAALEWRICLDKFEIFDGALQLDAAVFPANHACGRRSPILDLAAAEFSNGQAWGPLRRQYLDA